MNNSDKSNGMETNRDLDLKIGEVFDSLKQIQEVKISSSFRARVLNEITEKEVEEIGVFGWFRPKYQLAAIGVILLINISAIIYSFSSSSQESNINNFAQEYNLTISQSTITNEIITN